MVKNELCRTFNCEECLLYNVDDCNNIHHLDKVLTPEKEKELMNWYHKNMNTYINDFCKRFPNTDMDYVVNNVCCGHIYLGNQCKYGNNFGGCTEHWNSVMENE